MGQVTGVQLIEPLQHPSLVACAWQGDRVAYPYCLVVAAVKALSYINGIDACHIVSKQKVKIVVCAISGRISGLLARLDQVCGGHCLKKQVVKVVTRNRVLVCRPVDMCVKVSKNKNVCVSIRRDRLQRRVEGTICLVSGGRRAINIAHEYYGGWKGK